MPVNYVFGALIIKELRQLSDEELKLRCHTDLAVQHALHSTSWKEQPISERTFSRFRERCYAYELETGKDLIQLEMEELSNKLAQYFEINTYQRRMDSLMIASNTKNLSRLELLYTCVERLLRKVHKKQPELDLGELDRYLDPLHENELIYHSNQPYKEKLRTILSDAYQLKDRFESDFLQDEDYRLLCRVIDDQSTIDSEGTSSLKKGKEIRPTSLQTPVEPEATFRKKAEKQSIGYVANLIETVDEERVFITHYAFKPNIHSDQAFADEAIQTLGKQKEQLTLVADGAFDSEDAQKSAKSNGIVLVHTQLKGRSPNLSYAEVLIDEQEQTVTLPNGVTSQSVSYYEKTDTYRALSEKEACLRNPCELVKTMKEQKKTYVLTITPNMIRRANQAKQMKTKKFLKLTHFRNGIEGMPSVLRRAYQVDRIPFRGFVRKKHSLGMKLIAINSKRAIQYELNREKPVS